jgi:hypothetical protein
VEVLSNFQYLYVKTCVCFVSVRLWPHHNPLKLWGPSLCFGIIKKISMSQCVWWLINNFWTNGLKVIEFRVIFVFENELKFTNLGFNQLLHFHYIDPFVWPFTSHKKISICNFYTSFHIKITIFFFFNNLVFWGTSCVLDTSRGFLESVSLRNLKMMTLGSIAQEPTTSSWMKVVMW